jgi:hypothetical protein
MLRHHFRRRLDCQRGEFLELHSLDTSAVCECFAIFSSDACIKRNVCGSVSRYLRPEGLVVVAVGDRAQIEPQLAGLQLGRVEVRDLDGKPI